MKNRNITKNNSHASLQKAKYIVQRYEIGEKINQSQEFWNKFHASNEIEKQELKKNQIYIDWYNYKNATNSFIKYKPRKKIKNYDSYEPKYYIVGDKKYNTKKELFKKYSDIFQTTELNQKIQPNDENFDFLLELMKLHYECSEYVKDLKYFEKRQYIQKKFISTAFYIVLNNDVSKEISFRKVIENLTKN